MLQLCYFSTEITHRNQALRPCVAWDGFILDSPIRHLPLIQAFTARTPQCSEQTRRGLFNTRQVDVVYISIYHQIGLAPLKDLPLPRTLQGEPPLWKFLLRIAAAR